MWWSTVTITTVGYGDISPATPAGRVVAVVLMVIGVGVFGYVAGAMSSAMFDEEEDEILTRVRQIDQRLDALSRHLDSTITRPSAPPADR